MATGYNSRDVLIVNNNCNDLEHQVVAIGVSSNDERRSVVVDVLDIDDDESCSC